MKTILKIKKKEDEDDAIDYGECRRTQCNT